MVGATDASAVKIKTDDNIFGKIFINQFIFQKMAGFVL